MTVFVVGLLRIPPQNLERARPILRTLIETTRAEDGCLSYAFAEDLLELGLIRVSETWRDDAALAAHDQAPHMAPWRAASTELGVTGRDISAYAAGEPRKI